MDGDVADEGDEKGAMRISNVQCTLGAVALNDDVACADDAEGEVQFFKVQCAF